MLWQISRDNKDVQPEWRSYWREVNSMSQAIVFLGSIVLVLGARGLQGREGRRGRRGRPGYIGKAGKRGPPGDRGPQGPRGRPGKALAGNASKMIEDIGKVRLLYSFMLHVLKINSDKTLFHWNHISVRLLISRFQVRVLP